MKSKVNSKPRPHFHLNVFAHGHVHDHHHSHHHGHSHDGASKEIPASHDLDGFVTEHPHHDSDAIYIADTDVVLEKRVVQVQFTPVVHFLSPGSGFTAIDACARRLLIPESRPSFAAALSLRKIRLLL